MVLVTETQSIKKVNVSEQRGIQVLLFDYRTPYLMPSKTCHSFAQVFVGLDAIHHKDTTNATCEDIELVETFSLRLFLKL